MLKSTLKNSHMPNFIQFDQAIREIFQVETILVPSLACGTNVVLLFAMKLIPLDARSDKDFKNLYISISIYYGSQVILKKEYPCKLIYARCE